jgi:hypothetical protein
MSIFGFWSDTTDDEMAKKTAINRVVVDEWIDQLISAGHDGDRFERAFDGIKDDARLKAADIVAIAHGYQGGGRKTASRAAAIAAISRNFADRVRTAKKNRTAEKVRPW